jgi:hypothetical protein
MEAQRVREQDMHDQQQREIDDTPILTVPQITELPPILQSRNPTAKRALKSTLILIKNIKKIHSLTRDWKGNFYWDISLEWDYINQTINISLQNYIKNKL